MSTTFWHENISIGSLSVPRFMAAPLDGITDSPLRQLIRKFSPDELLMTEMRHVACVANEKEGHTVKFKQVEQPLAFQFSANHPTFIAKAIEKTLAHNFVMINLNCGCPAPTVIKSGSGSALMANPEKLRELIGHFRKEIGGRVPFTIKIRSGFKQKNAVDIAKLAQDCGVDALMIHPRTQPGGFTERLDYEITKQVKQAVQIPVIFSGNISRFEQAARTYEMTGADGFMIGRALWGAPWKLAQIVNESKGLPAPVITAQDAVNFTRAHLDLNIEHYGSGGYIPFKKQIPQYIRQAPNASTWRTNLLRSQTEAQMRSCLDQIEQEIATTLITP